MSRIKPNDCGIRTAAESPCNTREPISASGDHANAHSVEDTTKPMMPVMSIRLRPNMSPSRPPVINPTAIASVYAAATHSSADADAPRSRWIAGAAMFTIVESRMFMIIAASTTAKAAQTRGRAGAALGSPIRTTGRSSTAVIRGSPISVGVDADARCALGMIRS